MNRRTLAITILGIWIGSLGWLGVREHSVGAARQRAATVFRVGPNSASYALRSDTVQVGLMLRTIDTLPGEIHVLERWDVTLPFGSDGVPHRALLRHEAWLTRDLHLIRFHSERRGDVVPLEVSGTIAGDSVLTWASIRAGVPSADTLVGHSPDGWALTSTIPLTATYGPAGRVGGSVSVDLFDPLSFRHASVKVTATGSMPFAPADSAVADSLTGRWSVAHVDSLTALGLAWTDGVRESMVWTDPSGMPVRTPGPFGLIAERSAFEVVRQGYHPVATPNSGPVR